MLYKIVFWVKLYFITFFFGFEQATYIDQLSLASKCNWILFILKRITLTLLLNVRFMTSNQYYALFHFFRLAVQKPVEMDWTPYSRSLNTIVWTFYLRDENWRVIWTQNWYMDWWYGWLSEPAGGGPGASASFSISIYRSPTLHNNLSRLCLVRSDVCM